MLTTVIEYFLNTYFKYFTNSLPLNEFNINYTGNLINIVVSGIILLGIFLHWLILEDVWTKFKFTYISAAIVILLPYIFVFIFSYIDIEFLNTYLFGYPIKKIWIGFLLVISKSYLFFLMGLLWLPLFYNNILRLRSILFSATAIIFLLFVAFFHTVNFDSKPKITSYNNVGIVFGAAVWSNNKPSPMFQERIRQAHKLYEEERISTIQLTGANAPGELSEAKSAYNLLLELGTDSSKIKIEEETSNTTEQIKYIHKHLNELTMNKRKLILISDAFHLPRIIEISKFFGISAIPSSSDHQLNWEKLLYYRFRESIALLLFWIFGI